MPNLDQYQRAALDHCNELRVKYLGLHPISKLEIGFPVKASKCPIANTIKKGSKAEVCSYNGTDIKLSQDSVDWDFKDIPMPALVSQFQRRFDQGMYPELIHTDSAFAKYFLKEGYALAN